jgi:ubiquinone/menaquinone biosynthesis C-methylase UbiE
MMLPRVLEPEVMDSAAEARDYDAMDHRQVNEVFVRNLLAFWPGPGTVLDVGTGTAQIPIELCRRQPAVTVFAIDLAEHMLRLGQANVERAGLADRIQLHRLDAKALPLPDHTFDIVMSNSIVHHNPEPAGTLAEMVRLARPGAALFVRDLLRPADDATVHRLVEAYAGAANTHQRHMFEDSLRAALTLDEVQSLVAALGFAPATVQPTSDRHWTWAARRP